MSEDIPHPKEESESVSALHTFWRLLDLAGELSVCGFSLFMVVLGAIVFLHIEQGIEVLRGLAERGDQTGATNLPRLFWFGLGLILWSLVSWYSARVLLYCDFYRDKRRPVPPDEKWDKRCELIRSHLPRLLGALPMAIVGLGFLLCARRYETVAPWGLKVLSGLAFFGAVALYFCFWLRRKWLTKQSASRAPEAKEKFDEQLRRQSRLVILAMAVLSLGFGLLLVINPIVFAGEMGTGAVLVVTCATWAFWGGVLIYLGHCVQLPVLILLAVWVAYCSLTNDNHDLRTVTPTKAYTRPRLDDALDAWHKRIAAKYPGPIHPLYIVASEGGGIRAAYWTAAVLGTIQDEQPTFADHVFAISGVSGGSLGAVVFASLLPDGHERKDFARRAESMLGRDFLSPAIAAMLCPDFLQRFLPWGFTGLDRGRWLERSWEKAWRDTMQKAGTKNPNRFAESFLDMWASGDEYIPNLFLNGTSVERGKRVVMTNVLVDWKELLDADDATRRLLPLPERGDEHKRATPDVDLPVSVAAHLSARFTYLSPAGKFPADGTHVVDGGYFENSGATTALDILREVTTAMNKPSANYRDIVPKLIMISNNPMARVVVPEGAEKSKEQITVTTKAEQKQAEPGTFLEDLMAPVDSLLNTRDARGSYAQRAIGRAQEIFYENLQDKLPPNQKAKVYYFSLGPAEVPLPLGWMLSNQAAHAMHQELNDEGKSKKTPVETWNKAVRQMIIDSLPQPNTAAVPQKVGSEPETNN
jgi:hypothetical protein